MSGSREVVRRLHAWKAGRPLPRGETRHFALAGDADVLVLAFVRMGGESRPWGLAYGHPGARPEILAVGDGRDRDAVAGMATRLAPVLLAHLRCPGHVRPDPAGAGDLAPLRQVWVPNHTHLDMLHHLAYAYAFTKTESLERDLLRAFGRACNFLFQEAQRPGQQHVMAATAALRAAYTFPAEDARQGHLGYLLAWLGTPGGLGVRLAAAMDAEAASIATSLDPQGERDLEGAVDRHYRATRSGDDRSAGREAAAVRLALGPELERRFALTAEAIAHLRSDPRRQNAGVDELVKHGLQAQWYGYTRIELRLDSPEEGPAFVPSVETDRFPAAAGAGYHRQQASAELAGCILVHDDAELLAEAMAGGDAFSGRIVAVDDEGDSYKTRPVWTVLEPAGRPLRLRAGGNVCVVGLPKRTARIREIVPVAGGGSHVVLEITNLKTALKGATGRAALAPADPRWRGVELSFTKASMDGLSRRKAGRVWDGDAPGAWLTRAAPGGVAARVDDEDGDGQRLAAGGSRA